MIVMGRTDPAVFNRLNSQWTIKKSSTGITESFFYGLPGDIPTPGRFLMSNCASPAVHRPTGNFFIIADGYTVGGLGNVHSVIQWGLPGDFPVVVNVEGDELADISIFRPWNSSFYISASINYFFFVPFLDQPVGRLGRPISSTPIYPIDIPGDYNFDGKSDLVFASVNRNFGTTVFNTRHGGTTSISSTLLTSPGDAFVNADFDGDGTVDPAVVFVESNGSLTWKYRTGAGEQSVSYGQNGATPVAGDFDCDGKADKALVTKVGPLLYWDFSFARGGTIEDLQFGLDGDEIYAKDVNGDGCDEIIVSREAFGGIDWWYRNILVGVNNYVQWGLAGDELLPPADVNGDGRADFLVSRKGSSL